MKSATSGREVIPDGVYHAGTRGCTEKIRREPVESRRSGGRRAMAVPEGSGAQARKFLAMVDEDLRKLSGREEQVLRLLFGIGAALHSREEVGRRLGMSTGWLRQVERRAFRNLRQVAIGHHTVTETPAERRERVVAVVAGKRKLTNTRPESEDN